MFKRAADIKVGDRLLLPAWGKMVPSTVTKLYHIPEKDMYNIVYNAECDDRGEQWIEGNCMIVGILPGREFQVI